MTPEVQAQPKPSVLESGLIGAAAQGLAIEHRDGPEFVAHEPI